MQKVGVLLQRGPMPQIVHVGRDPAHAVRGTVKDPLHAHARFGAQWDRLFGGKGGKPKGLIPRFQHSEQWKALLHAAQVRVLQVERAQGGGLACPLRHFSFSKPRYESYAEPHCKYVCCVHAVALVLCAKVADSRGKAEERRAAQEALDALTATDVLTSGLSADYASVTLDFIRRFDLDHTTRPARGARRSTSRRR